MASYSKPRTPSTGGSRMRPKAPAKTTARGKTGASKNWIQGAVKRPGALTRKAKSVGMSTTTYSNKVTKKGSKASTLTKQQANFAKNMRSIARKNKK